MCDKQIRNTLIRKLEHKLIFIVLNFIIRSENFFGLASRSGNQLKIIRLAGSFCVFSLRAVERVDFLKVLSLENSTESPALLQDFKHGI